MCCRQQRWQDQREDVQKKTDKIRKSLRLKAIVYSIFIESLTSAAVAGTNRGD